MFYRVTLSGSNVPGEPKIYDVTIIGNFKYILILNSI